MTPFPFKVSNSYKHQVLSPYGLLSPACKNTSVSLLNRLLIQTVDLKNLEIDV